MCPFSVNKNPNDETYLIIISSSSIWAEDGKAKIIRAEELFVLCATYNEELLVLHRTYMVRNSNENYLTDVRDCCY